MSIEHRILEILYDRRGQYVWPQELTRLASLREGQLDKALDQLRQGGQPVESAPAHGLRLALPARLNAHLIERGLGTQRIGKNVICFDEVRSTNDVALDAARQGDADGLAVLAEQQRSGRGRLGRTWISPPGANILMSVLLLDARGPVASEAVTIAAGLAVAQGIQDSTGLACQLKWPNDVLIDGEKLAGILVETRQRPKCLAVGIGVNVNAAPPRSAVKTPATSLALHTGSPVERIEVVRALLRRLDLWTGRIASGETQSLHDQWLGHCDMINHRVSVVCGAKRHVGRILDIHPLEGLVLCCDDGQVTHLPASSSSIEERQ